MWTVSFNEYLQFDGVKESIQKTKYAKKMDLKKGIGQHGQLVEETVAKLISDTGMDVKFTTPQMDIGFGADLLVSYEEENKNYSFYVDITSSQKDQIKYLAIAGTMTENHKEAFCYTTEYGKFYFGVKERHANWFFYEKPVVVVYVENFVPCTGLAVSHIQNIRNILISVNDLLTRLNYGARASKRVRPNMKRFYREYVYEENKNGKTGMVN